MSKELETLPADAGTTTEKEPPAQLATLARDLIVRSKTNPRTHFDPAYINELRASFKEHGVLQPLLVRPLPGSRLQDTFEDRAPGAPMPTHEIVCGECRWRGTEGVVDELPVLIRHLTDLQVLQVQLVENLKRRDLHPIEEAEGFDRLMTEHGLTVEDIAARIDKSVSYIFKTRKLLELTKECREELYKGNLTRSTALLVARAPAYLQVQIAQDIMKPDYSGEPMSFRKAVTHIQQHYMLQLGNAVFDIKDANLVRKAGACGTCAKNTGANGDMFEDVTGAASCTDPKCFDAKKEAHYAAVAKAAAAMGQTVIQGKEAKELMPTEWSTPEGYKLLDHSEYINGKSTTLRKLLGKDGPTPVLIINPHTKKAEEMVPVDVASKVIKKAAAEAKKSGKNKEPNEHQLKAQFEDAWQGKAVEQIHAAIMSGKCQGITVAIAREIAGYYSQSLWGDTAKRFARLFEIPDAKVGMDAGIADYIKTCPDKMVGPALLMLMLEDEFSERFNEQFPVLELLATDTGVDVQALQDQAKEDMRAEAEAHAPKSETKAAKPAGNVSRKAKPPKTTAAEAKAGISEAMSAVDAGARPQSLADLEGKGLSSLDMELLTQGGIHTIDDLAGLTVDELVMITNKSEDEGKALITKARSGWFESAKPTASAEPKIGDTVRIKDGVKGPTGHLRKICGRTGTLEKFNGTAFTVRFSGVKDTAQVRAEEFDVTNAAVNTTLAAWPFPTAPLTTAAARKTPKAKKGAAT
ncbi:ParB/RepB/Spo0J family partition protein [Caenimonas terrae]|uniref:ParB/RepB/Spo0J family partition protein n=1 Tax=Caenimonas terrae TaxID=696074 RepID=A0ABW0NDZ9_9BURK